MERGTLGSQILKPKGGLDPRGLEPMAMSDLPTVVVLAGRLLTAEAFKRLADVPPELEWFANLNNQATRRAYENALQDFMKFTGIERPEEFREVTRAHVIAWRDDLARRALSGMTIRHRLAALSSLFEYLCDKNAVTHNPVKGVKRPAVESYEGKTPAIGDHQARGLLDAPDAASTANNCGFAPAPTMPKKCWAKSSSRWVRATGASSCVPWGDWGRSGTGVRSC